MTDATQALQPVDRDRLPIGVVLSTTFRIIGKAPLLFILFGLLSQSAVITRLLVSPPTTSKFGLTEIVVTVVNFLLLFLVQTAVTYIAVRLHDGQRAAVGESLSLAARRFLPMVGTSILVLLGIYAAMIAFIVPGIILALIWAVAITACAIEGSGPITSMKRSAFLTKGERWRILGIYCLFFLPLLVFSGANAFAVTMTGHLAAGEGITAAIQIFWLPLATIFSATIYVELRRLKENVSVARIFD